MAKRNQVPRLDDSVWQLTVHVTTVINVLFDRKLRPSRAMHDAIRDALEAGYSTDEVKVSFWVARCIAGDVWLKQKLLSREASPELVLRHKGGINTTTGAPAKRWLDEMLSRASETNGPLVAASLDRLPPGVQEKEREMLTRMDIMFGDTHGDNGGDD